MYENAFTGGLVYWKRNWVYDQNVKGKKTTIISASSMVRQFKYSFLHFFFLVLEFYYYRNSECWDLKHWHSLHLKRCDSLIHDVILLRLRERITLCNTCVLLLLLLVFLPALSGTSENWEQKNILETIEQLIQLSYLFL